MKAFEKKVLAILEDMQRRKVFSMEKVQAEWRFGATLRGSIYKHKLVERVGNQTYKWMSEKPVDAQTAVEVVRTTRTLEDYYRKPKAERAQVVDTPDQKTLSFDKPAERTVSSVKKQVVIIDSNGNRMTVTGGDIKSIEVTTILG